MWTKGAWVDAWNLPTRQDLGELFARTWFETTIGELYAYFAILMDYWRSAQNLPSHPMVYQFMSLNRFEQLQRYSHVSDPDKSGPAHTKVSKRSAISKKILYSNR